MTPEIVLTHLHPQHDAVFVALCELGVRNFAGVTREIPQEVVGVARRSGINVVALEPIVPDEAKARTQLEAARDADRVAAILRERSADGFERDITVDFERRRQMVLEALGDRMAGDRIILAALDRLAQDYTIRAAVFSEEYQRQALTMIQWSKARGVPTFHILHGANLGRPRGIYARSLCDWVLVAGRRGGESFADIGVDTGKLVVIGAPGWDSYAQLAPRRNEIRSAVRAACNLPESATIVTYAVTTFEMGLALVELQIAERTLRAFMAGARQALDRGANFAVVVKDRRLGGHTGQALVEALAAEFGVPVIYAQGRAEHWVIGSDVIVACDSNISIEAILCGTPAINIWSPMGWIDGPFYAAGDNILQTRYDEPALLGELIGSLIADAGFRGSTLVAQAQALEDLAYRPDGNAAKRCAKFVIDMSTIREHS